MAHAGKEIRFCEVGFFRHRLGAFQFGIFILQCLIKERPFSFYLFARSIIGADQQVADNRCFERRARR